MTLIIFRFFFFFVSPIDNPPIDKWAAKLGQTRAAIILKVKLFRAVYKKASALFFRFYFYLISIPLYHSNQKKIKISI